MWTIMANNPQNKVTGKRTTKYQRDKQKRKQTEEELNNVTPETRIWILLQRYKNRTIRLDSLGNQRQRMLVWALGNCSVPLVQQERNLTDRDTMKRIDEQELEAHYSYMAKIQEGSNATQELIHESIRTSTHTITDE
ncbi:hypothetical protein Tco_0729435 [Tanacetum coccineum]|uniref:Uncharacterized protein n=1 Tax=Tanacetum coccineum TaxID=301880 RepID=A0ABQ4YNW3_9ASTR